MRRNLVWLVVLLAVLASLSQLRARLRPAPATPTGEKWALEANGYRMLLELALEPRTDGQGLAWKGRLQNEHSLWEPVDHVSVTPGTGSRPTRMEFRRNGTAKQWYTCEVVHGHLLGHFSHRLDPQRPGDVEAAYPYAVEGWCPPPVGWTVGR